MSFANEPATDRSDAGRILLIGDIEKAFSDAPALRELPCEICTGLLKGLDAAAKNTFAVIAVVMSGLSSELDSAMRTVRQVASGAKIILLARMHEEPAAIEMVAPSANAASLADDYLICPIEAGRFYQAVVGSPRPGGSGAVVSAGANARLQAKIGQLEKLATEDDLTGLKNRRYILEFSRQIIERAGSENRQVTLLVFDIDNLKSYNDTYGHLAGDEILRQVAMLMRRCCRGHDVVGRMGGDEFAVVFWDGPRAVSGGDETERRSASEHPKQPIFIARRFRTELERASLPLLGPGGRGVLTISGGLATFPRDGATVQTLFQQADKALLEAKRSGKNKIYLVGKPESDIADIK